MKTQFNDASQTSTPDMAGQHRDSTHSWLLTSCHGICMCSGHAHACTCVPCVTLRIVHSSDLLLLCMQLLSKHSSILDLRT